MDQPCRLERPGFAETVLTILREVGLPPQLLQLEITESLAMSNPEHTAAMIGPLREAGVSFALDDFGTGYSSLSILSSLPIDGLKIDRSFIAKAGTDACARVIIETILVVARSLRYETIPEGIEEPFQADFLSARAAPSSRATSTHVRFRSRAAFLAPPQAGVGR